MGGFFVGVLMFIFRSKNSKKLLESKAKKPSTAVTLTYLKYPTNLLLNNTLALGPGSKHTEKSEKTDRGESPFPPSRFELGLV